MDGVPRPGIRGVAEATGLSVSTVSRALNGYADVNPDTRRRVEEAAERLGYRPSFAASVLRRSRTSTVTFMVSKPWTQFVDPLFLGVLDGVEQALARAGHDLQVVLARDHDGEIDVIRRVVERRRCDALIFARTRPEDERVDWLEGQGFPFVTIGQTRRNSHSWVDRDQARVSRESVRRLAARGHRRIALLSTPLRYTYSEHGRDGYRQGLAEAGLSHDPGLEAECFLSRRTGAEVVAELLATSGAPTALVCGNDMIALSAMEGLRARGLRPGLDVAMIGCDDVPLAAHLRPALTTFALDLEALGGRLADILLGRLAGDAAPVREVLQARLVVRDSDGPTP